MAEEKDIGRRKFMELGIFVIGGSIATVSGGAMARFAIGPSFDEKEETWLEVDQDEIPDEGQGMYAMILEYPQKDGYMSQNEKRLVYAKKAKNGEVVALCATCTHLGCIVTWNQEQQLFFCPCHAGIYDADGNVVSGPPPFPLRRHKIKIEDGQLYVSTEIEPIEGGFHA